MIKEENAIDDIHTAEFSINNSFNLFTQSFNRIKYFSSIANNVEIETLPINWSIQNKSGLTYMVSSPNDETQKSNIVNGYKHFIHCYLVRDCIESFAMSLDSFCFMLLLNGKRIRMDKPFSESLDSDEKEFYKKFERAGISSKEGKMQLLKSRLGIELPNEFSKVISSLKDIRNCFAHRNGFVRQIDGKKDGKTKRKFIWNTMNVFAKGVETGNIYPMVFGEKFPESVNVCMKLDDHVKSYNIGSQLSFTSAEAYEIAFSLQQVSVKLIESAGEKHSIRNNDT